MMQSYHSCTLTSSDRQSVMSNYTTGSSAQSLVGSSCTNQCSPQLDGQQSVMLKQRNQIEKLMVKCREQKKCIIELQDYIDELQHCLQQKNTIIQRILGKNEVQQKKSDRDQKRQGKIIKAIQSLDYLTQKQRRSEESKNEKDILKEQFEKMQNKWIDQINTKEKEFSLKQYQLRTQIEELKNKNQEISKEVTSLRLQLESAPQLKSSDFLKKDFALMQLESWKENKMINSVNRNSNFEILESEVKRVKRENNKLKQDIETLKKQYQIKKREEDEKSILIEQLKLMKKEEVRKIQRQKEESFHQLRLKEAQILKLRSQLSIAEGNNSSKQLRREIMMEKETEEIERQKAIRKQLRIQIDKMESTFNKFQLQF